MRLGGVFFLPGSHFPPFLIIANFSCFFFLLPRYCALTWTVIACRIAVIAYLGGRFLLLSFPSTSSTRRGLTMLCVTSVVLILERLRGVTDGA